MSSTESPRELGNGVMMSPPEVVCRASSSKLSSQNPSAEITSDGAEEVDMTDWQSVVKEMLSIHLPSSQHQPSAIRTSPKASAVPPISFSPAKNLPSYVTGAVPDLEALGSGSPKASRSPMAASSPRNSTSGLLLVRIDESQALDTSSDCGDTSAEMLESLSELDQFARPMRYSDGAGGGFRRSRLAGISRARATSTGGDDNVDGNEAGTASPEGRAERTRLDSGPAAPPPQFAGPVRNSKLSKYHPDAPPLVKVAVPALDSSKQAAQSKDEPGTSEAPEANKKKMRRSVVQRISDHGCEDDEECREEFADERLSLDVMKRDVEETMRSQHRTASDRRNSDSSQAFSWTALEVSRKLANKT